MRVLGFLLCLAAWPCGAAEFAVLANGTRLQAERHETEGNCVRLYRGGGVIELRAADVAAIEIDAPTAAPPEARPEVGSGGTAGTLSALDLADGAADKYGLPRGLVRSVMAAESGFQPHSVSPKGAVGLMQLMPSTARELGADPHDPAQNVDAGAHYLRDLLLRYNGRLWLALAAYNAGPSAVEKYDTSVPPYPETVRYVVKVDRSFRKGPVSP
jgi:soluble lytic murein transglycosylase-like protein